MNKTGVYHCIKINSIYFTAVLSGDKRFELRKNDRDYREGDTVLLYEWNGKEYTGRNVMVRISYVLENCEEYGLKDGYCIFGWRGLLG